MMPCKLGYCWKTSNFSLPEFFVFSKKPIKINLMNKIVSLAFLAVGVVLIIYGINGTNSLGSDFSRFFTGSPTDKSIWLLIGGCVVAAIGAGGLITGSKSA